MATQVELSRYGFKWWINAIVGEPQINTTLTNSITSLGTTAVTTEEVLWTYTLPAATLAENGRGVRITVWYTTAANAQTKSGRLYFGATVVSSRLAQADNGQTVRMEALVLRSSATAQTTVSHYITGANAIPSVTTPAETMSGAIVIKFSGQNGTAAANDMVFQGAVVELV